MSVGASGLKPIEAKRVDIYVWSVAFQTYFKVTLQLFVRAPLNKQYYSIIDLIPGVIM